MTKMERGQLYVLETNRLNDVVNRDAKVVQLQVISLLADIKDMEEKAVRCRRDLEYECLAAMVDIDNRLIQRQVIAVLDGVLDE